MPTKRNESTAASSVEVSSVNQYGLSEPEMLQAKALQARFPSIVGASTEFYRAGADLNRKYFTLCDEVRKAKLQSKEIGLLLRSLGYGKTRVSEMKKAISVADDVWERYRLGQIARTAVLQIARTGVEALPPGESDTEGLDADAPGSSYQTEGKKNRKPPTPPKEPMKFPKHFREVVEKFTGEAAQVLKPTPSTGYEFTYETKTDKGTRSVILFVEVIDKAPF